MTRLRHLTAFVIALALAASPLSFAFRSTNFGGSSFLRNHRVRTIETGRTIETQSSPLDSALFNRRTTRQCRDSVAAVTASGPLYSTFITEVNTFYQAFPLISSVLTCSFKGCFADLIAQFSEKFVKRRKASVNPSISWRRNSAAIVYSGLFMGTMYECLYNRVYPIIFGAGANFGTVFTKVTFDSGIAAPLFWLPPAYLIKAIVYGYSPSVGLSRYIDDIRTKGLLTNYWKLWIPVQVVNFAFVPAHLRIAFIAAISFGWLCFLSKMSSKGAH